MAVTSLQLTFAEISQNIALLLSVNRTRASWSATTEADVVNILRGGLRKAYYPPPLGPGQAAHQWSFLRPYFGITTTAPYTTGTVTVTDGAVVGSGTTFPALSTYYWFVYGGTYYEIASYTNSTHIQLTNTTVDISAGASYSLRQYKYALPTDFVSLDGPLTYAADESTTLKAIENRSEVQLRKLYMDGSTDDWVYEPTYYSIIPSAILTTAISAWYLLLWPTSDSVFHLKGRYNVQMFDLDATNLYPPGGAQHSQMILEACLSEAELAFDGAPGPHTARFFELLSASISLDRQTSTPDTLGTVPVARELRGYETSIQEPSGYMYAPGTTLADYLAT